MESIPAKTQTIVVSQERCKIFEMQEEKEKFFIPTEFDNKIEEFCESVRSAGGAVQNLTTHAGQENIIGVITWFDAEGVKKIENMQRFALPNRPPDRSLNLV